MTPTQAHAAIKAHRDTTYPDWCRERGLLNFALAVLEQIDPYPAATEGIE